MQCNCGITQCPGGNLKLARYHASTTVEFLILTGYLWNIGMNTGVVPQVRIAEDDNTTQYWPNLGSQESAIVIGLFASVKCWADDGGLFRLFKFTDLQPKLGPVSALYQADCNFYYGIQF